MLHHKVLRLASSREPSLHHTVAHLVGAIIIALAWLPVLTRFFRSWRARGNPISLAICVLIGFAIYVPCYLAIVFSPSWPIATVNAIDGITCATFYVAIRSASRKFPDTRKADA